VCVRVYVCVFVCLPVCRFRVSEFKLQFEALRRGLATVVPHSLLSAYTWDELERKVVGTDFDVDLLQRMTEYRQTSETEPHVKFFWQMMREIFGAEERAKFLTFGTQRSLICRVLMCVVVYGYSVGSIPLAHNARGFH
jgi:hypothetical protein